MSETLTVVIPFRDLAFYPSPVDSAHDLAPKATDIVDLGWLSISGATSPRLAYPAIRFAFVFATAADAVEFRLVNSERDGWEFL